MASGCFASSSTKKQEGRLFGRPSAVSKSYSSELESLYVLSLPALGSLDHIELNLLAFLQRAEALRLNGGVVDEYVLAILAGDKAKTFCVIEPLYFAFCTHLLYYLYCFKIPRCFGGRTSERATVNKDTKFTF